MKLFVNCIWKEHRFEVFIDEESTIEALKAKIESQIELPIECQRLIIGGRDTENGRILLNYNVKENMVIHLAKRRQQQEETKLQE